MTLMKVIFLDHSTAHFMWEVWNGNRDAHRKLISSCKWTLIEKKSLLAAIKSKAFYLFFLILYGEMIYWKPCENADESAAFHFDLN